MAHMYNTTDEYSSALDDIEAKLDEWKNDLENMSEDKKASAKDKLDDLQARIGDFRDDLSSSEEADGITDKIENVWNGLKKEADELVS